MGKRKLGRVTWSLMFKVDKARRKSSLATYREDMWKHLKRWDKMYPEALSEWAYTEEYPDGTLGNSWYDWHGFLSRKTLEKAAQEVFKAFPENLEIEVFKDTEHDCWANVKLRKKIVREGAV